jgi:hypothetical protein
VNSPWSWRDAGTVDVGTSNGVAVDLLKYSSQWVFNSTATKAICLRGIGDYASYADLWTNISNDAATVNEQRGKTPTAIELSFDADQFNPVSVTKHWLGIPQGAYVRPYGPPHGGDIADRTIFTLPTAAGYDDTDVATFCMTTAMNTTGVPRVGDAFALRSSFTFTSNYNYTPIETDGVVFSTEFAEFAYGLVPRVPAVDVLDIRRQAVVATGMIQKYLAWDLVTLPFLNPLFEPCWVNTTSPTTVTTVWVDGVQRDSRTFANPDGNVMHDFRAMCWQIPDAHYYYGTYLPLSAHRLSLPSFAVNRSGAWMLSYLVLPQPKVSLAVTSLTSDCVVPGQPEMACSPTLASGLAALNENVASCRGGWMDSSFADSSHLADMTQTRGDARFLYVRPI